MPSVAAGWERNEDGKLATKVANLGQTMDPVKWAFLYCLESVTANENRLAETQVDLNNKLMKWRIAPDLDLERIKNTKCLLLGAGTLGSYVARILQVCFPLLKMVILYSPIHRVGVSAKSHLLTMVSSPIQIP